MRFCVAGRRSQVTRTRTGTGRRGLEFLVETQKDDGSWHVASRSRPIQRYFESGFPHGKDQFISMSATGWAVAALALACPKAAIGGLVFASAVRAKRP